MPRRRTCGLVTLVGACFAPCGRARVCPTLGFTVYWSRPRKPAMVSAFAFDSTITSGLATGESYGSWSGVVGSAVQCGRRGGAVGVSAPESGVAGGLCQLRVVPEGDRVGRLSCAVVAVVHLLSSILALSLDPKEILNDLSPYGEIGLILIIFAET